MSALDDMILFCGLMGDEHAPDCEAELAALRFNADECDKWRTWKPSNDEYIDRIEKRVATLTAQNAEQARQLSEARRFIEYVMPSVEPYMVTQLRAWLSATAPAPQDARPA